MIAFQVSLNDEPLCLAGIGDLGVLTAVLSYVQRKEPLKSPDGSNELPAREMAMEVTGLRTGTKHGSKEHVKWKGLALRPGDRVSVQVVEVDRVDEPASVESDDPVRNEKAERRYYELLKKKYEDLKS